MATALNALLEVPAVRLAPFPTPIQELDRLRSALGPGCPRLLMKRDDLLAFGAGGNKVRKMQTVAAEAIAGKYDTLITCGGVQSNHARVTAAAGAALGLRVVLVANGAKPELLTGNARLNALFGADVHYVSAREERAPMMEQLAGELRAAGRRPLDVPLGASTPLGALGFARAIEEVARSTFRPTAIVHATSSGGTQAGLIVGSALFGMTHEIIGISADDPSAALAATISTLVAGAAERLGAKLSSAGGDRRVNVVDSFVGEGYGVPTAPSREAMELTARTEGIVLDPVYTAKAMAGLIDRVRAREWAPDTEVLFWHTGGVPGFFA
jgi:1-aminocyclopropane-1-carboxylate deaminase/D-cysteine desulfhydrase-like pyridoxal-dependent ACC family enzyme